jgi:hypothetical protein
METEVKVAIFTGIFVVLATGIQYGEPIIDHIHDLIYPPVPPVPIPIDHDDKGDLLFSDYFTNPGSGWSTIPNDPNYKIYYDNVSLNFELIPKQPNIVITSSQEKFIPPNNFIIEFDANTESSGDHNRIGVDVRKVDVNNTYLFSISSDGYYNFAKFVNRIFTDIIPWTSSPLINKGIATNTIKVKCDGDSFIFYINGREINTCADNTFSTGSIGLVAGVGEDASGDKKFSFDNLRIWSIAKPKGISS